MIRFLVQKKPLHNFGSQDIQALIMLKSLVFNNRKLKIIAVKSQTVKPLTKLVGKALVVHYKHQENITSSNSPLQAPAVHHKF